ncbi:plasma membrane-associated cation-binding protein 2-like [Macadamia integrifolia]|uniref:plasma membrane-associated cation-binding protein 2-like n=1 Tax=Macadamia integrifolia TaxID=60698 RepID=UPI001C4ECF0D|nr:plasma membrane-associated cation-binding protein 2-like [Macadamia integrifolia]
MGGCATKPKTFKGEDDLAPAPIVKDVSEPKEVDVNGEEAKLVASHEEGAEIQSGEEKVIDKAQIGDGEGDDSVKTEDTANKPRSLSNLFKESEEEKESSGNDKTTQTEVVSSEPVQQEEEPKTEIITKEVSTSFPEAEETATTPEVEEKPVEEEKPVIAAEATEIEKEKTENEEEKRTEEKKEIVAKDV